jgi:hypothetical protein
MKFKALFVAALVVISSVVSAAGKDEPRKTGLAIIPVKGTEVFKVIYKGENTGKVKINIYNANGEIIFSETISSTDGFICPVNFKGLTSGEYTIELVDATGKRVEKVSYQPVQPKKNLQHVHVSRISSEEGKFLLAISSIGAEKINVNIYDANNNLVHTENKDITGNFAQVYKIENASGAYTFEISDKAGNTKTVKF